MHRQRLVRCIFCRHSLETTNYGIRGTRYQLDKLERLIFSLQATFPAVWKQNLAGIAPAFQHPNSHIDRGHRSLIGAGSKISTPSALILEASRRAAPNTSPRAKSGRHIDMRSDGRCNARLKACVSNGLQCCKMTMVPKKSGFSRQASSIGPASLSTPATSHHMSFMPNYGDRISIAETPLSPPCGEAGPK
jgi:hypothetical protein